MGQAASLMDPSASELAALADLDAVYRWSSEN